MKILLIKMKKKKKSEKKKTVIIHPHPQFNVGVNLCQMLPVIFVASFAFPSKKIMRIVGLELRLFILGRQPEQLKIVQQTI